MGMMRTILDQWYHLGVVGVIFKWWALSWLRGTILKW